MNIDINSEAAMVEKDDEVLSIRKKYWENFYCSKKEKKHSPSDFCRFVCDTFSFHEKTMIDFCCGNGRDSYHLAKYSSRIFAIDYAIQNDNMDNITFIQSEILQFIQSNKNNQFDITYSRFGLHSLDEETENAILDYSNTVFFEFRSDKDTSFINDHYRRTINGNYFIKKLIDRGYEIIYFIESNNLAVYAEEDPMIIRVIASKVCTVKDLKQL